MIREKLPHTKSREEVHMEKVRSKQIFIIFWHIQGIFTLHIPSHRIGMKRDIKFEFIETHSAKWNKASDYIIFRIRPHSYLRLLFLFLDYILLYYNLIKLIRNLIYTHFFLCHTSNTINIIYDINKFSSRKFLWLCVFLIQ